MTDFSLWNISYGHISAAGDAGIEEKIISKENTLDLPQSTM